MSATLLSPIFVYLIGCAALQKPEAPEYRSAITERPGPEGLIVSSIDLDGDGVPEVHNYLKLIEGERLLVRKELDLNRDGAIDQTSWYDHGTILRREIDDDFDGVIDRTDHFLEGERVLTESDADDNGSPDNFRYFVNGVVERRERDTTGDGRVDTWEYFESQGVARIGVDEDADGVIDIRTE